MQAPRYSVIIPIYNEAQSVESVLDALRAVMDALAQPYEVIVIDDGSTDESLHGLRRAVEDWSSLSVIALRGHWGKEAALQAGFDRAEGEALITMDGDGQNDPEDIPRLLQKLEEGYDLACGWRQERDDPLLKRWASWVANGVRRCLVDEPVHDVGCELRVFRRALLEEVRLSEELHRFFTWAASHRGFRVTELPVRHHTRRFGTSKFGMWGRGLQGCRDLWRLRMHGMEAFLKQAPAYAIDAVFTHPEAQDLSHVKP